MKISVRLWTALAICAGLAVSSLASFAWASAHGLASSRAQSGADYSATLEQCTPASLQADRSVTFTGEIVAVPGTRRMGMRIELQQRAPEDASFHTVLAPGLGVWRNSETGVKIYRYVKQITNLAAPAVYRAAVRFRWQGDKGHILRRAELVTAKCEQPLLAPAS